MVPVVIAVLSVIGHDRLHSSAQGLRVGSKVGRMADLGSPPRPARAGLRTQSPGKENDFFLSSCALNSWVVIGSHMLGKGSWVNSPFVVKWEKQAFCPCPKQSYF